MLEWLKTILGDAYTEEIDKKVSEEIGKNFVARADFNEVSTAIVAFCYALYGECLRSNIDPFFDPFS